MNPFTLKKTKLAVTLSRKWAKRPQIEIPTNRMSFWGNIIAIFAIIGIIELIEMFEHFFKNNR